MNLKFIKKSQKAPNHHPQVHVVSAIDHVIEVLRHETIAAHIFLILELLLVECVLAVANCDGAHDRIGPYGVVVHRQQVRSSHELRIDAVLGIFGHDFQLLKAAVEDAAVCGCDVIPRAALSALLTLRGEDDKHWVEAARGEVLALLVELLAAGNTSWVVEV